MVGVEGGWTDVEGAAVGAVGFETVPVARSEKGEAVEAFVVSKAVGRGWVYRKVEGWLVRRGLRTYLAVCLAADEGDRSKCAWPLAVSTGREKQDEGGSGG